MATLNDLNVALRGSFVEAIADARGQPIREMVEQGAKDPAMFPATEDPSRKRIAYADVRPLLARLPKIDAMIDAEGAPSVRLVTSCDLVLLAFGCEVPGKPFGDCRVVSGVLLFPNESPVGHELNAFMVSNHSNGCSFATLDAMENAFGAGTGTYLFPVYAAELDDGDTARRSRLTFC